LTSPFGIIAQMWLALFLGSLQMISEPPNNARSCGIGALHDDRTKFGYSQENEPLGRIALRKYRDRTTENGVFVIKNQHDS
jgi:hypothetical protein